MDENQPSSKGENPPSGKDNNSPHSCKSDGARDAGNVAAYASLAVALVALVGTIVVGYLQSQSAKDTASLAAQSSKEAAALSAQSAREAAALSAQSAKEAATLSFQTAERASDVHLSEIAVSILRAPPTDDVATLRDWAMDVIDHANSRKFTRDERNSLLKKPIAAAALPNPCPSEGRNQNIADYAQFSVLIFYKTSRTSDCRTLMRGLEAAGFPTTSIGTTFEEVAQYHQFGRPDGSNFIIPNQVNGTKIATAIQTISKQNLPKVDVMVGDGAPISRGDVQVNLY
jgi:hypothetical protein